MAKILIDTHQAVFKITLNDPDTLNAMGAQMATEFRDAIESLARNENNYRCLLITGAGRGFCSGGNVAWIDENQENSRSGETANHGITLGTHHHHALKLLKNLPIPIVTAVNGPAAGIGFSYAMAGDMIVAARSAFFVASYRNIGISPDGGMSWMLPRLIGVARAKELLLMGNRLPAEKALEWGLVNRVFDDETFQGDAMELAQELAEGPTVALGQIRKLAWQALDNSFENHLDLEEEILPTTFATEDSVEGPKAMLEKRKAEFKGR